MRRVAAKFFFTTSVDVPVAAAIFAINANAQLGLIGGVNSMSTDIESAIAEYQKIDTYHAGIVYKLNLPLGFSIQPGS